MNLCVLTSRRTQRDPSVSSTQQSSRDLDFAYPLLALSTPFLLKSMWPLPSYTPTAGHSLGHSPFSATTLAIRRRWMSSSHFLRPRVQGRSYGWISMGSLEGYCWPSSSNRIRASKGSSSRYGAASQTSPSWMGSLFIGWRNLGSRNPETSRTYPRGNERCALSSHTWEQCLALSSCSSLSTTLRLLRAILVSPLSLFLLKFLFACVLYWSRFLCYVLFLCMHGT